MNNQTFREEIHNYIDIKYNEFEAYQRGVIESLIEFDRVCKQNNIKYFVGFGALLGLYRDGCILPWDYDIDVLVPIYEKERLIEALKKDLNQEKFYFYCPEVDKKCRHFCMRITCKGYDSSVIHMDVFYLIGAPEDEKKREKFRNKIKWLNFTRKLKLVDLKKESMGIKAFYYAGLLKKILYIWCPIFLLNTIEKRINSKYDMNCSKYVTTMQAAADTYSSDIFQTPSIIAMGNEQYNAPTDVVKFFEQTYKNYKGYPPIQSRFDEFYSSLKKLDYFHSKNNLYEKMDFQINQY